MTIMRAEVFILPDYLHQFSGIYSLNRSTSIVVGIKIPPTEVAFDNATGVIRCDGHEIYLGPSSREYKLFEVMFDSANKSVPWDEIYTQWTGDDSLDKNEGKKINAAVRRINVKSQKVLGKNKKLLQWKGNTVIKLF